MSSIDDLIRERLQKLRADDQNINKNLPSSSNDVKQPIIQKKVLNCDQVEDLLSQLSAETNLEAKSRKEEEDIDSKIRTRLERLKSRDGCNFSSGPSTVLPTEVKKSDDDIHDEDFFNNSSCGDLLNLGETSDSSNIDTSDDDKSSASEDLDTACVLCDTKPTLICLGCEKDCYCNKCYKEFHCSGERHKTVPYTSK